MTLPCAARSTLVYLERGDAPRCTKALSPFNQTSWQEMWCPGVILGPSNTQLRVSECLMWGYNMIFSQLNGDPCPAWTTERGKLKRGWSPGDSLNLVRVLSVRVNYSQQCRNDINGRWEYSKSIMSAFLLQPQHVNVLVQDCSISIVNALEILQFCIKPSMWTKWPAPESVFYLWLNKVSANEGRHYICNVFPQWLEPCS